MAKTLRLEDQEPFDTAPRGCLSGLFHALDNQFRRPTRKHDALVKLKRAKRKRRPKRVSHNQDSFELEVIKLLYAKSGHILVDPTLKARVSPLVSEDVSKENDSEERGPGPILHRTTSIHRLESDEWVRPIVFLPKNIGADNSGCKQPSPNDTKPDRVDVFEIFKVNKALFQNALRDGSRAKLTKSGSFPTSGRGNLRPSKLEDKLKDFRTTSRSQRPDPASLDSGSLTTEFNGHGGENATPVRKASSLNESANRYAQSYGYNVDHKANLRSSRSLKLANESEASSTGFLTRIHSSPRVENLNRESHNAYQPKAPEIVAQESPVLVFSQEETIGPEFRTSQGSESLSVSDENLEETKPIVPSTKHEHDFAYVKQVLGRSGFTANGLNQKWYSSNQPLDPLVFQEIESRYPHDPEHLEEDFIELSHRLLVFDLVDEVLLTTYETLFTHYPRAGARGPTKQHVLSEVWESVSRLLDLRPDMSRSLDAIVAHDLRTDRGWMNLQPETESVALELEDLILDELLEQVLCC